MKRKIDHTAILSWIRDFAENGERCPTAKEVNAQWGKDGNAALIDLARQGKLTIEISAHNWRVIEVDGVRTAANPIGKGPYRRIDSNGDQWLRDGRWERLAA